MRTMISLLVGLLVAMWTPALAQSDVFFVSNPETAVWTYRETDHASGDVRLSQYSLRQMTGDAVNGRAEVRILNYNLGEEAPADSAFVFYRFNEGEAILDFGEMFTGELIGQIMEASGQMEGTPKVEREQIYQKLQEDLKITGEMRGIPRYPQVGKLPAYEMKIKILFLSIKISSKSRKITGVETLCTPAGDYECFVLEEVVTTRAMMTSEKSTVKTWYAYGIGMVKQETYVDDELESTILLDSINW